MVDVTNKYIGVARFRQHRSKVNACVIAKPMRFIQNSCSPEFSLFKAATGIFGYAVQTNIAYLQFDRLRHIWMYASSAKTGSLGTTGKYYEKFGYFLVLRNFC